jgi:hypothetical protein
VFELSDFYGYCRENSVQVIPFVGAPAPGTTIRDGTKYAVFLDFSQIPTTRLLRGVCAHEMSHVATGALHKVSSPFELVERSEYRAGRYMAERFLSEEAFREAFRAGCRELWQLAEWFDLPQEDVEKALRYWTDRRCATFHLPT